MKPDAGSSRYWWALAFTLLALGVGFGVAGVYVGSPELVSLAGAATFGALFPGFVAVSIDDAHEDRRGSNGRA